MDLKTLTQRAIEIRNLYSQFEIKQTGKQWTNLNLMEGFVADIGELMKLIVAKEGVRRIDNVDEKISHELSDCLWSILVLANKYNIDLEKSFTHTMDEQENKINSYLKE